MVLWRRTLLTDQTVVKQTQSWVESVIVGLNFCPFAKREVEAGRVNYQVSRDADVESALHALMKECQQLDQNPDIETTLLIYVNAFQDFDDYLDFLEFANELLLAQNYEGIYQLASFHPDYCFEGESIQDAANYTNRSPYPMVHLIREASLEKVLKNYPEPECIPERNIKVARNKGTEQMQKLLAICLSERE